MVARIRCSSRRVAAFESRSPCPAWARQRRSAFVGRGSSSFPLSHLSEYRGAPRLRRRDRGAPGFTPGAPNVGGFGGPFRGPPFLLSSAAVLPTPGGTAAAPVPRSDERPVDEDVVHD